MFYCCNQECEKLNDKEFCNACGKVFFIQKREEKNKEALNYLREVIKGLEEYNLII